MTEKMKAVLEDLQNLISEKILKKFGEETVSAMTAPYARPLGVSVSRVRPAHEPAVEEIDPEEQSVLGGKPRPEKAGDPESYGKEKPAEDKGCALKEDMLSKPPKEEEPKGKALTGKNPKTADDGDPKYYGTEKTVRELGKIKETDVPSVEKPKEPPVPQKKTYEIYVKSSELGAAEARAVEAVKPIVGDAEAHLCVKFSATKDALDAVKKALSDTGFVVVGEVSEMKPRILSKLAESAEDDPVGARWDQTDLWARLDHLRDAGFEFKQACNVAQMSWDMIPDRIRRRIKGLKEESESATSILIEAIFNIDQAIGHLEILHDRLEKEPDVEVSVKKQITNYTSLLMDIAARLTKLRGKVI